VCPTPPSPLLIISEVFPRCVRKTESSPKESTTNCSILCIWAPHSGFCGALMLLIYRVSQEERAKLREGVPYVKLYRYNPKDLYPKLNGYGDNGHRKEWASGVSTYCTPSVTPYSSHCACPATRHRNTVTLANALQHGSSDVTS